MQVRQPAHDTESKECGKGKPHPKSPRSLRARVQAAEEGGDNAEETKARSQLEQLQRPPAAESAAHGRGMSWAHGRMGACCDAVREAVDRLQHSAQLLRSRKELRECRSEDDPRIPHIRTFATKSCDCCFVQAPLALAGPV